MFIAVMLMTVTAIREVERILHQRRRLGGQVGAARTSESLLVKRATDNSFFRWVTASTSISDVQERRKLGQALLLAGFENPNATIWYVVARFSLAIALPILFLSLQSISPKPASGFGSIFWPMLLCGAGLLLPGWLLASRAASRRVQLEAEFPDALDLMVVCVEAGLSLDAAFLRVGQEISESHPGIAHEFARVSEQLRAGRARPEALRTMVDRTGVDAIKSFVSLLIQTEALGTGIAQTLRTYSKEMRDTRYVKAEEKAMRIPVLMTIPLVVCILPVIVTALLLPAMIDVVRTLIPSLMGVQTPGL